MKTENQKRLEAEYNQIAAAYGDAVNRKRGLDRFITDTERKLDEMERAFQAELQAAADTKIEEESKAAHEVRA